MLIIQCKTQLENNYRNISKVIFDNCHMHIVIQTMDTETAKFYNQFIAKKTIISHSYSDKNKSSTEKGIDLFGTDELLKMPLNEAIVIYSKENPMKTKFIPMWKVESYLTGMVPNIINMPMTNQEFTSKYFFDLTSFTKNNVVNNLVTLNELSEELNTGSLISQKNELFERLDELIEEEKFHSTRKLKEEITKIWIEIDDINLVIKKSILNTQNKSSEKSD